MSESCCASVCARVRVGSTAGQLLTEFTFEAEDFVDLVHANQRRVTNSAEDVGQDARGFGPKGAQRNQLYTVHTHTQTSNNGKDLSSSPKNAHF